MGLPRRRAWPCKNTMGLGSDAQATAESAPPRPGQALLSVGRHRSAIALAPQSSRQAAQNSPPPASYSSAADAATSTTRAEPCRCDTDPATPRMHNRTAVAQPRTVHHTSARPTPPENGIPDFRSALHRRRFRDGFCASLKCAVIRAPPVSTPAKATRRKLRGNNASLRKERSALK